MIAIAAHKCDKGRVRPHNEDYVWVNEQAGLYILADGMGGHDAGDVASHLAATTIGSLIANQLKARPLPSKKMKALMITAINTANDAVFKAAHQAGHKRKMGTTVIVTMLQSSNAYISHVGDSRAYLARGSTLTRLTEDDTWKVQFGGAGQSEENTRRNRYEHFLTQAVGQESTVDPSFKELALDPGDYLLLCSDGLWGMLEDEQILSELLKLENDPTQVVEALVASANAAGGKDNISVIAIKMVSPDD